MVRNTNLKKWTINNIAIVAFLLFTASTCNKNQDCSDSNHKFIEIKNNSSKTINWRHFTSDSVYTSSTPASDLIINPYSSYKYGGGLQECWEETFKNGYSSYFLIFDNDTVQAIGWQAISGTNRGLLKKVKVDLNYLNDNNFTITYP